MSIESEVIKYVWLDEDGEQVGSLHKHMGSALNFIANWDPWMKRLNDQLETAQKRLDQMRQSDDFPMRDNDDWEVKQIQDKINTASKSGKPPHNLVRLVIRSAFEDLNDAETDVLRTLQEQNQS